MCNDESVAIKLASYETEIEFMLENFEKMVEEYPLVFPTKLIHKDLFENLLGLVYTRCFG